MFARINNCTELAIKNAVEELGGSYTELVVPADTPNDDVSRLVSERRATWREQLTTLLKGQPAPVDSDVNMSVHSDDDFGAAAHDDNDDDRPVIDNHDNGGMPTDWALGGGSTAGATETAACQGEPGTGGVACRGARCGRQEDAR